MPIYVYQCADCEAQTEKRQGFADPPLATCESCGGSVRRVLQPVGIIFKGSGFYSTDYRGGSNGKKDTANGDAKTTTESAASTSSESKSSGGDKPASTSASTNGSSASSSSSSPAPATSAAAS